jgi:hypothetical protein
MLECAALMTDVGHRTGDLAGQCAVESCNMSKMMCARVFVCREFKAARWLKVLNRHLELYHRIKIIYRIEQEITRNTLEQ